MSASEKDANLAQHRPGLGISSTSGVRQAERNYVAVGDVVAGKYLVERVLGVGGMGFVVSARHLQLDEHFALKFLKQEFLNQPVIMERFTREAKTACKIRSEHVARVYDVGSHEGAPFLVMEHLTGRDLAIVLSEQGSLCVEDAVEFVIHACEALAVAHSHGIVHRDIKPENLFVVEQQGLPFVKVVDFGISKIVLTGRDSDPGGPRMSRLTGTLTMGTPCYMSPEQIRSTASADARSDLWSLGVVLYELLTGAAAFQAGNVNEVCAAVLEQTPLSVRDYLPEIPEELAKVIATCLEKDPERRYGSVAELAHALLPFAPPRAVASAERAASILGVSGRELDGATSRPSAQIRLSHERLSLAPASGAPLVRSLTPGRFTPAAARLDAKTEPEVRQKRPSSALWIVLAGVALVIGNGLAFRHFRTLERSASPPPTTTALPHVPAEAETTAQPRATVAPPAEAPKSAAPAIGSNLPSSSARPLLVPRGVARPRPPSPSPRAPASVAASSPPPAAPAPASAPSAEATAAPAPAAEPPKPSHLDIGY